MTFEVRNASFGYKGGKNILSNISLCVEKGEILSILGSNGVGKTTLLRCTLGFQPWRKGATFIDGIEWSKIRRRITDGPDRQSTCYRP